MKKIILTLILKILYSNSVTTQYYFNTVLPSVQNNVDGIYHPLIEQSKDSLICFTATTYLRNFGGTASISVLNGKGNLQYSSTFLDSTNTTITFDSKLSNQYFFVSGTKFMYKDTAEIFWYAKLNYLLDTIWTREIRTGYNRCYMQKILSLKNRNIALCGTNDQRKPNSQASLTSHGVLAITDSLGEVLHFIEVNDLDTTTLEGLYGLTEDSAKNIYSCGIVKNNDLNHDALIIKASPEGKLLWRKQIPSLDYSEGLNYCYALSDGSILFVGVSYKPNFFDDDFSYVLLINLNPNGKINFTKRIIKGFENFNTNCVTDLHGDFICAGYYKPERNIKSDGWICKFTPNGDSIWSRSINNSDLSTEQFFNIANASDGGYYLTGFSFIKGINTSKSWIVKVDSFGCLVPGCQNAVKTKDVDEGKVKAFEFYPNPAKEVLYFLSRVTKNDEYSIRVFDLQGKEVYTYNFMPAQGKQYIMEFTNNVQPGIYVLRILDGKGKIIQSESIEIF